jgi:hypothetical protein
VASGSRALNSGRVFHAFVRFCVVAIALAGVGWLVIAESVLRILAWSVILYPVWAFVVWFVRSPERFQAIEDR